MRKLIFLAIIICVAISLTTLMILLVPSQVIEEQEVAIDLQVDDEMIGFNTDTEAIHLGRVHSPGSSERGIDVRNDHTFPLQGTIYLRGNITSYVRVNATVFELQPSETERIIFYSRVPADTPNGNYSGFVKIEYRKG
ncbi:MAG: hypothetical protein KJ709_05835 [Nanoarchaeota archaeon]|nr:hypothetical protein [Nanoarchaeota archaeon]